MATEKSKEKRVKRKSKEKSLDRQISRAHRQTQNLINESLKSFNPKMDRLRDLDLFILDNSIRETTVGQLRGHTLEDKFAIYEQVKKCGFEYWVVEHFHRGTRVGDKFLQLLKDKGEDMSHMFAFTEFYEDIKENKVLKDDLPIGFKKSKKFGLKNLIIEVDLCYHGIDYKIFNKNEMFALLVKRLQWVYQNLGQDAKILINLRDWADAMNFYPSRVFWIIEFLCKLPKEHRPFGIMVEELGKYLPDEVSVWTEALRKEMNHGGWKGGHLLVHVHEQWGMANSTQLEMLASGANGVWAGICAEDHSAMPNSTALGAAMGHASSCVTAMNLIRLGNKKIQKKYNCSYFREAAINVTKITTGYEPHPKQPVYGARSLDLVFGLDITKSRWDFNFAGFVGLKPEVRISENASPEMIVAKLKEYFGENDEFTLEMGRAMIEKMLEKLKNNDKEESNSMVGLAMLFGQTGGKLTEKMATLIEEDSSRNVHVQELIKKIKERWDNWHISNDGVRDDHITFDAFYNGFMAPYFGCYRCEDTQKGLSALDMDKDGTVEWREFALYLKWAGRQFPECRNEEELLDLAFRKGLIPAMQHVLLPEEYRTKYEESEGDIPQTDLDEDLNEYTVRRMPNSIIRRTKSVFQHKELQVDDFFGRSDNAPYSPVLLRSSAVCTHSGEEYSAEEYT